MICMIDMTCDVIVAYLFELFLLSLLLVGPDQHNLDSPLPPTAFVLAHLVTTIHNNKVCIVVTLNGSFLPNDISIPVIVLILHSRDTNAVVTDC